MLQEKKEMQITFRGYSDMNLEQIGQDYKKYKIKHSHADKLN